MVGAAALAVAPALKFVPFPSDVPAIVVAEGIVPVGQVFHAGDVLALVNGKWELANRTHQRIMGVWDGFEAITEGEFVIDTV